jgi:hypothetical protein
MPPLKDLLSQLKKNLITMAFKSHQSPFRTLRSKDPNFTLTDGLLVTPRAGFEISSGCPYNYREIIQECVRHGWLKPVANVYDHELTFDVLKGVTQ